MFVGYCYSCTVGIADEGHRTGRLSVLACYSCNNAESAVCKGSESAARQAHDVPADAAA